VAQVLAASREILEACIELGGSVTGEHGVGVEKIAMLERLFGSDDLDAMRRVRAAFDPELRANPGKLLATGAGCAEVARPGRQAPL
jgi:glycolate oxidase